MAFMSPFSSSAVKAGQEAPDSLDSPGIAETKICSKIHILGMGNVGSFVAHSLAGLAHRPPITLLLHRQSLSDTWRKNGEHIELRENGVSEMRGGFDVELVAQQRREGGSDSKESGPHEPQLQGRSEETIDRLIVAVKAPNTASALSAVKDRLTSNSTILFLHNGMGIVEEVNEKVFPSKEKRPNYMLGIVSHGINSTEPFVVTLAGLGTLSFGILPEQRVCSNPRENTGISIEKPTVSSHILARILTRAQKLVATEYSQMDLLQLQLKKLAINAVINPLTAILDCRNGRLLDSSMVQIVRPLVAEISSVIQSLPELQGHTDVIAHFTPERLETLVFGAASRTAENISSMLQDMRAGKPTEVKYINGYIVRRGEETGSKCLLNSMLMHMVLVKQQQAAKTT